MDSVNEIFYTFDYLERNEVYEDNRARVVMKSVCYEKMDEYEKEFAAQYVDGDV